MTKQRNDSHSTEFGIWLREQKEIDSELGYIATNIDYVWKNYKSGLWMFIEEKRYTSQPKTWQKQMFSMVHKSALSDKNFRGFHLIVFENTSPDDGKIWINNIEVTKAQLIAFLQFKYLPK